MALTATSTTMPTAMAPKTINVIIVDGEHFKKAFSINVHASIVTLISRYREYLCPECTDSSEIEFSFGGIKIDSQASLESLGICNGGTVHARASDPLTVTRWPCSARSEELRHIHYLDSPAITEIPYAGAAANAYEPIRIRFLKEGEPKCDMTVGTRANARFEDMMKACAALTNRALFDLRFLWQGHWFYSWSRPDELSAGMRKEKFPY